MFFGKQTAIIVFDSVWCMLHVCSIPSFTSSGACHTRFSSWVNAHSWFIYAPEFPERQNALLHFLIKLSKKSNNKWNITQFHYRSCGSSVAKVLCGLNVEPQDKVLFESFLNDLSYNYKNETNNIVYSQFN